MSQISMTGVIVVAKEVDGVEMGVLEDGTPFLTGRGLAKACGIAPSALIFQAEAWKKGKRDGALARLLQDAGYDEDLLYVPIDGNGVKVHAYTDAVATIVLEYYALENNNETAKRIYRILVRQGLREFIYKAVGYDQRTPLPRGWRDFHDRLLLSRTPAGYFSVFREMSDFLLRAMQAGLPVDAHTVPDGSVGKVWSIHWEAQDLDEKIGVRRKCEHNYPDYYPQAASNPQDIWIYPVEAVGAFRRWLDEIYIPEKFPAYLDGKVKKRVLARGEADRLLVAVMPALLGDDDDDGDDD